MQFFFAGVRYARRRPMAVVLAASCLVLASLVGVEPAAATSDAINRHRTAAGLPPVQWHDGLASIATEQARAMAKEGRLFHSADLGGRASTVVPDWDAVAENVGAGASMDEVDSAFMQSSSHRANILGDFTLAGVGAVTGSDGKLWVTQVFARVRAAAPAPPPPSLPPPDDRTALTARPSRAAPAPVPAPPRLAGFTAAFLAAPALGQWRDGYYLFDADGGVRARGGADFAGSIRGATLERPVVAGASTPRGEGYWLAAQDGGVFAFGDAPFLGSAADDGLAADVVGLAPARDDGYWLVAGDGGVFAFGDAAYHGGLGAVPLQAPVTAVAATPSGRGYWLVAGDGGVFAFGDATHAGGLAGTDLVHPVRAIVPERAGSGYRLVDAAGEVFSFGRGRAPASTWGYSVHAELMAR
jgi:hypothetical protein